MHTSYEVALSILMDSKLARTNMQHIYIVYNQSLHCSTDCMHAHINLNNCLWNNKQLKTIVYMEEDTDLQPGNFVEPTVK